MTTTPTDVGITVGVTTTTTTRTTRTNTHRSRRVGAERLGRRSGSLLRAPEVVEAARAARWLVRNGQRMALGAVAPECSDDGVSGVTVAVARHVSGGAVERLHRRCGGDSSNRDEGNELHSSRDSLGKDLSSGCGCRRYNCARVMFGGERRHRRGLGAAELAVVGSLVEVGRGER